MKIKSKTLFLIALVLFIPELVLNADTYLKAYEKKHFQYNRYLFKNSYLYKKKGRYFYKYKKIKKGYYKSSKRITRKYKHNFLFIPAHRGWIKEVYTSASPKGSFSSVLPIGKERIDKWYALPNNYIPKDLITLSRRYCRIRRIKVRQEASYAFMKMHNYARKNGVLLYGFSGYRSFYTQRYLFLRRIRIRKGIKQEAVAKPGHSEHQLGTAIDVVGKKRRFAAQSSFGNTTAGKWLRKNCYKFGFVLSYGQDNKVPSGYMIEPWHIRYIGLSSIKAWMKKHIY